MPRGHNLHEEWRFRGLDARVLFHFGYICVSPAMAVTIPGKGSDYGIPRWIPRSSAGRFEDVQAARFAAESSREGFLGAYNV